VYLPGWVEVLEVQKPDIVMFLPLLVSMVTRKEVYLFLFQKKCALQIFKNMLGDDIQDLIQDVKDTVCEFENIISWQAMTGYAQNNINLQGSTPAVIFL
jgi:CheY-specific phosphatase CheX